MPTFPWSRGLREARLLVLLVSLCMLVLASLAGANARVDVTLSASGAGSSANPWLGFEQALHDTTLGGALVNGHCPNYQCVWDGGSQYFFKCGYYTMTQGVQAPAGATYFVGDGDGCVRIQWAPNASSSGLAAFTFGLRGNTVGTHTYSYGIRGMLIYTPAGACGAGYCPTHHGIMTIDTNQVTVEDLTVNLCEDATTSQPFNIALYVRGREFIYTRRLYLVARTPLYLQGTENTSGLVGNLGVSRFTQTEYSPCTRADAAITVAAGTNFTDDSITESSVVFGSNAFTWVSDSTNTLLSQGLTIANMRWEQMVEPGNGVCGQDITGHTANGYIVNIDLSATGSQSLEGLVLSNLSYGHGSSTCVVTGYDVNGVRLNNVHQVAISQVRNTGAVDNGTFLTLINSYPVKAELPWTVARTGSGSNISLSPVWVASTTDGLCTVLHTPLTDYNDLGGSPSLPTNGLAVIDKVLKGTTGKCVP